MGQEDLTGAGGVAIGSVSYYAFILESAAGVVAIATWPTKPSHEMTPTDVTILDASSSVPGRNGITVGDFPVAIATDKAGCFAVTANAGSCDMSALSVNSAVSGANFQVNKLTVKNAAGQPIGAKAAAMVAEPSAGAIGVECPAQPTGIMYVAYPSCHLVAAVDVSTGNITGGVQFDAANIPTVLTGGNVTCPDECGGSAVTAGARPVALDLKVDARTGRRALAVAADNSNVATIVELGPDFLPTVTTQVAFENTTGKLGLTQVALTPQIGMGGSSGFINDDTAGAMNQFQFLYAVANDNSVRVADILNMPYGECDAQVDPRYLIDNRNVRQLSCLRVGDPLTPPERPGMRGPGIQLRDHGIPTSVAVYKVDALADDMRADGPGKLIGYFGVITATTGQTYLFNVDDDSLLGADFINPTVQTSPLANAIPLDIAHQLRDAIPDRGAIAQVDVNGVEKIACDNLGPDPDSNTSGSGTGPRAPTPPTRTIPAAFVSPEKVDMLPDIRNVLCVGGDEPNGKPVSELTFAAPIDVRIAAFPDLMALQTDEIWTLTWEGLLSQDSSTTAINGPTIRTGQLAVDSGGLHLQDTTGPFCAAGVELDDIVQLRGCDPTQGTSQCPAGYTCYVHPESKVANLGACMASDEADRLADACKEFLTSLRRYTVGRANTGELLLLPRKHVLRTTPIDGCTSDSQCQTLANLALQQADASNPVDDKTPPDTHTWKCIADPNRGPSQVNRCVEACSADSDCDAGYVCDPSGVCMEGVLPPQACVNAPQRYDLRASEAFTAVGSRSGYIHPIIDVNGTCVRDPAASPLHIGRVPLTAPACDPTADPRTGLLPSGKLDANPCETVVDEAELDPVYQPGTCTLANPATQLVTRKATAIRFRNPGVTLHVVDPTYPGDAQCIGDRAGNLGRIPVVSSLFQLVFRLTAGFSPLSLGISPTLPIRVVNGPGESIWVIDQGDFLSTSLGESSTRGRVYRVESVNLSTVNTLE
jgi:hypothetical protein